MTVFTPTSADEVRQAIAWAAAHETPVEVIGAGSKRAIGRPAQAEHTLDLSKLTGVTLYEPEELVLSARSGTPVAEIEALLAEHRQQLAFEPMDYGPLLGGEPGHGTIGGVLATNLSGPRRIKAGAARDHILGVQAVSGRGEAFKSGGRVVKNVTGYDLSKLMAGSWGTLAVLTDVTFKVLPAPEIESTLILRGLDEPRGVEAMAIAMGSAAEVSGAAHIPEGMAGLQLAALYGGGAATSLRLEGFGPSVDYRFDLLARLMGDLATIDRLDAAKSTSLWQGIRDCLPFADGTQRPVWRVSMTPSKGVAMVADLRLHAGVAAFYDWQGGLIWLRMEAEPDAEVLRALIARHGGGHATLVRAPAPIRAATACFEPQSPALAALSARLKAQFDPKDILNSGRMA